MPADEGHAARAFPTMDDFNRAFDEIFGRAHQRKPDDLISMREAVDKASAQIGKHGGGPVSDSERNSLAEVLSRHLVLYSRADGRAGVRALTSDDMRGGRFIHGGSTIAFRDHRSPIQGIAVSRPALASAIATLQWGTEPAS